MTHIHFVSIIVLARYDESISDLQPKFIGNKTSICQLVMSLTEE